MKRLRVLNVEDNPDDSLLIRRELHKAGYDLVFERVETAEQMGAALDRSEWDVVISDYSLPRFSVPEALTLIAERGLDLPFILISGVLTEEKAVSLVGARASDYLLKCNLARLGPAVRRILQESELKNESSLTKDALEQEIAAREEERRRIARELHDEAGQLLTSLLARARVIEEAASLQAAKTQAGALRELTAETMDSISRLALGLHPTVLDDLGLSAALEAYVDEYEKSHGIEVDADIEPIRPAQLNQKIQLGIFRIVQEALTNIAKHATAGMVSVKLGIAGGQFLVLRISDNGSGFDVELARNGEAARGHYGLRSMRDRASLIGAQLEIQSRPGSGTSVVLTVPLKSNRQRPSKANGQ